MVSMKFDRYILHPEKQEQPTLILQLSHPHSCWDKFGRFLECAAPKQDDRLDGQA